MSGGLIGGLIIGTVDYAIRSAEIHSTIKHILAASLLNEIQRNENCEKFRDQQFEYDRNAFILAYLEKYYKNVTKATLYDLDSINEKLQKEEKKSGSTDHSVEFWDALASVREIVDSQDCRYKEYMEIAMISKYSTDKEFDNIESEYNELLNESNRNHAAYEEYIVNHPRPVKNHFDDLQRQIKNHKMAKESADCAKNKEIKKKIKELEKEVKDLERNLNYENYRYNEGAEALKRKYEQFDDGRFFVVKNVHNIRNGIAGEKLKKTVDLFYNHYAPEEPRLRDTTENNQVFKAFPKPEADNYERPKPIFCYKCGYKFPEGSIYCPKCGVKIK